VGSEASFLCMQRLTVASRKPRIAVIGCGKIGSHAARALADKPVALTLVNRTEERAEAMAAEMGCLHAPWSALSSVCDRSDGIIVATGAEKYVITPGIFAGAAPDRERLVIDLAVPRNVAPSTGEVVGLTVVDLDSLDPKITELEQARLESVSDAEAIVEQEVRSFGDWLDSRRAGSALEPLRTTLLAVCEREVAYAAGEGAAEKTASRIVAKMMAAPMEEMRELVRSGGSVEPVADLMRSLFPQKDA